jgi:phage gp45-like
MKKMNEKKFLCIVEMILFIAMILVFSNSITVNATTKVKLNATKVTLTVEETKQLKVVGTKVTVKWSSSNKNGRSGYYFKEAIVAG